MNHYRIFGNTLSYHAIQARNRHKGDIAVHIHIPGGLRVKRTFYFTPDTTISQVRATVDFLSDAPTSEQMSMVPTTPLKADEGLTLAENGITHELIFRITKDLWRKSLPLGKLFSYTNNLNTLGTCAQHSLTDSSVAGCTGDCPVGPGTNVEGTCKCSTIPSTAQTIVHKHGLGLLELTHSTFVCPSCKTHDGITPLTVVLLRCQYRFHGIDHGGQQFTSAWEKVPMDIGYKMFNYLDLMIHWRRLVIESAGVGELDECVICLKTLVDPLTLSCGHQYHKICFKNWDKICPTCQYNRHLLSGN
jgi:hypothetical protein